MKRLACTPTTSALADLVAERVVARLDAPRAGRWLTAAEVARRFGIDRSWVYEHRDELRGVRLGGGPRGHLRFDAAKVGEALTAREESTRSEAPTGPIAAGNRARRARTSVESSAHLLPIKARDG